MKQRISPSMRGSAADTTRSANTFLVNRFTVTHLPRTYRNPHSKFAASYRHLNPLTGADMSSPGVTRYTMTFPKSRRYR